MTDYTFAMPEFADNPEPRAAMVILIDQSPSMSGQKLALAQEGLNLFIHDLQQDSLASKRAEVSVVGFGGRTETKTVFVTPDQLEPMTLDIISGGTATSQAVTEALDALESRKATYRTNGVAYYRPWVVLITDGEPTDSSEAYRQVCARVRQLEGNGSVVFMGLGVEGADMHKLAQLSARPPMPLRDVASFREFFLWLSASLKAVSQSRVGDRVNLPPMDWHSI